MMRINATLAQSKLALTMWSMFLGQSHRETGPGIVAVNPGSMLGTKMVREGFGAEGKEVQIGADILAHLAVSTEAIDITGRYFDNDSGQFNSPHEDALSSKKNQALIQAMDHILAEHKHTRC